MAQILKLTDGFNGTGTELVNVDNISNVEKHENGSKINLIHGSQTFVAETPDQIWNIINGLEAGPVYVKPKKSKTPTNFANPPKETSFVTTESNWEHHK